MGKKSGVKKNKGSIPLRQPSTLSPQPAQVTAPPPQTQASDRTKLVNLIQELEKARSGRRTIAYWMSGAARISDAVTISMYDQLCKMGKQEGIDLYLYTTGGDTEIPIRLTNLIREFCNNLAVLIPHRAHSSGTLLAMGADEIIMTPLAVLGPIDPSRRHPLLPKREGDEEPEPVSVQDMRHAMQFIMETAKPGDGTAYTPEAMAKIVTALFDKIHPLAIGAIEQSYALAKLVGTKCLCTHMDPVTERDRIETIVNRLCDDYKSHGYQITRGEAKDIGLKVVDAPPDVDMAMMNLMKFYMGRDNGGRNIQHAKKNDIVKLIIAWLDSTDLNHRVEQDIQMVEVGQGKPVGDRWVPY